MNATYRVAYKRSRAWLPDGRTRRWPKINVRRENSYYGGFARPIIQWAIITRVESNFAGRVASSLTRGLPAAHKYRILYVRVRWGWRDAFPSDRRCPLVRGEGKFRSTKNWNLTRGSGFFTRDRSRSVKRVTLPPPLTPTTPITVITRRARTVTRFSRSGIIYYYFRGARSEKQLGTTNARKGKRQK